MGSCFLLRGVARHYGFAELDDDLSYARGKSNTSPILNLAIVNQLALLQRQFGEILIPSAVLDEL